MAKARHRQQAPEPRVGKLGTTPFCGRSLFTRADQQRRGGTLLQGEGTEILSQHTPSVHVAMHQATFCRSRMRHSSWLALNHY